MFWDKMSSVYDLFENVYNHRVYSNTGKQVCSFIEPSDEVLECACGTGAITVAVADKCKRITATDFSEAMLKQAKKKCSKAENIVFKNADITNLEYADESFDKVVAGNVIHLLPEPDKAYEELKRVVKPGGKVIIPTYINKTSASAGLGVKFVELLGLRFAQQFDLESYRQFFENLGCKDVSYHVVDGRMPCAIAVITKE
jgi:ubiquinone/menaquinone biosynthesis C-methylase UbiE